MFGRFRKFSSGILPRLNIPNLLNLLNMLNPKPFPTIFVLFVTARRAVSCLRRVTKPARVKRSRTHHLRQSLKVSADNDGSVAHMRGRGTNRLQTASSTRFQRMCRVNSQSFPKRIEMRAAWVPAECRTLTSDRHKLQTGGDAFNHYLQPFRHDLECP